MWRRDVFGKWGAWSTSAGNIVTKSGVPQRKVQRKIVSSSQGVGGGSQRGGAGTWTASKVGGAGPVGHGRNGQSGGQLHSTGVFVFSHLRATILKPNLHENTILPNVRGA